jgi:hypothetical protein
MARKKTQLDIAVEKTAEILQEHMSTLSPAEARAMRKEIHALAVPVQCAEKLHDLRKTRVLAFYPVLPQNFHKLPLIT